MHATQRGSGQALTPLYVKTLLQAGVAIPRWLGIPRHLAGTRHRIPFGERPHPKHAVVRRPK